MLARVMDVVPVTRAHGQRSRCNGAGYAGANAQRIRRSPSRRKNVRAGRRRRLPASQRLLTSVGKGQFGRVSSIQGMSGE